MTTAQNSSSVFKSSLKSWLLATRPKTLAAAVSPILVGTAIPVAAHQAWNWLFTVYALLASLFIQVGTNFVNDAVDFEKGADTEKRIGPQRVTQAGIFSARQVKLMAALMFLLAVICGIPLVLQGGWPIVIIGICSVAMGYSYTAGPFPLAYLGLAEIFVIAFFGVIAVMGLSYIHSGVWSAAALMAGLQVGFMCTVLLAINNLRDVTGDVLVNKKTLAVRFGTSFARAEIAFLALAPYVMGVYWLEQGLWKAAVLPILTLPLAIKVVKNVFFTEPSPVFNKFLAMSGALHLSFGVCLAVGLCL
jgi:1,4-dihydroxy-2-naphthoate octaprenyltransferase